MRSISDLPSDIIITICYKLPIMSLLGSRSLSGRWASLCWEAKRHSFTDIKSDDDLSFLYDILKSQEVRVEDVVVRGSLSFFMLSNVLSLPIYEQCHNLIMKVKPLESFPAFVPSLWRNVTNLELGLGMSINLDVGVILPNLRFVKLNMVTFENEVWFREFFRVCPNIELFSSECDDWENIQTLSIECASLKVLKLDLTYRFQPMDGIMRPKALSFNCPRLCSTTYVDVVEPVIDSFQCNLEAELCLKVESMNREGLCHVLGRLRGFKSISMCIGQIKQESEWTAIPHLHHLERLSVMLPKASAAQMSEILIKVLGKASKLRSLTISQGTLTVVEPSFSLVNLQQQLQSLRGLRCWSCLEEVVIDDFDDRKVGNRMLRDFFHQGLGRVIIKTEEVDEPEFEDMDCWLWGDS